MIRHNYTQSTNCLILSVVPRHIRFGDVLERRLLGDHSWRSLHRHPFLVRHPRLRGDSQLGRHPQMRRFSQPRWNAKLSTQLRWRDTRSRLLNA